MNFVALISLAIQYGPEVIAALRTYGPLVEQAVTVLAPIVKNAVAELPADATHLDKVNVALEKFGHEPTTQDQLPDIAKGGGW